jgi:phage terminase large subunit-like protein
LRQIKSDARTVVSSGSTFDNAANLAPSFLSAVRDKYEGTRLGRQELYAEMLDEAEGALWTRAMVEAAQYRAQLPVMKRVVVAIDPAISAKEESDETGIVAAGLGADCKAYVLADRSLRGSPAEWAKTAIALFHEVGADRIIAEGNQGGDMVRHTIQTQWNAAPVTIVHASRGKAARAEPVSALYEQNRVRHVAPMPELEDQLVTWEPLSTLPSPDRLDALVWAITELMVKAAPAAPIFGKYGNR